MAKYLSLLFLILFVFIETKNPFAFCSNPQQKQSDCNKCRQVAEKFMKKMNETAAKNSAGGDVSWEEERNFRYSKSEMRFIEVMEDICPSKDYECDRLVEKNEHVFEDWFFGSLSEELFTHLCVKQLQSCCEPGQFGKDCVSCPRGGTLGQETCSGHGKCIGEGYRKADKKEEKLEFGRCKCDKGYRGKVCDECVEGYYAEVERDVLGDEKGGRRTCEVCGKGCKKCSGKGAENCFECKPGFFDKIQSASTQQKGTHCESCHQSCVECKGPTSSDCVLPCKDGYYQKKSLLTLYATVCSPCECNQQSLACDQNSGECVACTNYTRGFHCDACLEGFEGDPTQNIPCEDVDECSESLVHTHCPGQLDGSQICINSLGSFQCICAKGYRPNPPPSLGCSRADIATASSAQDEL
eukprot:Sdes_comp9989_c0_seq1m1557